MITAPKTGTAVVYTGHRLPAHRTGAAATVTFPSPNGATASIVFADGVEYKFLPVCDMEPGNPATAPCFDSVRADGGHTWIRLVCGNTVQPGTPYGCQHCPARATGADLAAAEGKILVTKDDPPVQVHAVERYETTRGRVLARVGTHREAVALINAVTDGEVLRRGEIIDAYTCGAAEWVRHPERGWVGGYAPCEGSRREAPAELIPARRAGVGA